MSDAPAREPSLRVSSLIKSLRMSDLQRLLLLVHCKSDGGKYLLGDRWRARAFGEGYFVPQNVGEGGIAVLALERRCSVEHLVYQDAECPPIDSTRMAATLDHFRRNVLLCAYKRIRTEVVNTRLRIYRWEVARRSAVAATENHRWATAGFRLFRQVKV